jgi:hypothetical protein
MSMFAYFFQEKIHPTRSYLRESYRQEAPNFVYLFIDIYEKFQPTYSFIPENSFKRELRV